MQIKFPEKTNQQPLLRVVKIAQEDVFVLNQQFDNL
jgi:hypothetical protein